MLQIYKKKVKSLHPTIDNCEVICDFTVDKMLELLDDKDVNLPFYHVFSDNKLVFEFGKHANFDAHKIYIIDFVNKELGSEIYEAVYDKFKDLGGGAGFARRR